MGTMRLFLILALTTSSLSLPQPPRPTRTLGSLFGSSKPTQPPNQPTEQQKSLNSVPQQVSNVRPLVYQVKYYDRIQNNLIDYQQDSRYPIDKAGLEVPQVVGQQGVVVGTPNYIPNRYYYNPLIPQQEPLVYTIAQVGNTQVLIPCTQDPYIQDSQVTLNVEPSYRVPTSQPPPQSTAPQPQRTPIQPGVQQPLVRDQVIAAAQELTQLNALPGSAIVGANVNSINPYTQGSYFYYYLIPPTNQVEPQVQRIPVQSGYPVQYPGAYPNPYQYVRYNGVGNYGNYPVVPVVLGGYPVQQQVSQQSAPVPVRTAQTGQQQQVQTTQQQVAQQQQQQQMKG